MKKILWLVSLLLSLPTFVMAWGVQRGALDTPNVIPGIARLANKSTIRYAVASDVSPDQLKTFLENIQKWPSETLQFIQKSDHAHEFRDVVGLLKQKLNLIPVEPGAPYDLKFSVHEIEEAEGGAYFPTEHSIIINPKSGSLFSSVTLHEFGHYFGLADQSLHYLSDIDPEHSSDRNVKDGSIMLSLDEIKDPHLTCDDADGFINLLDLYLARQNGNKFSARSQKGWKSLCKGNKNLYREARTVNRGRNFEEYILPFFSAVYHYQDGNPVGKSWLSSDNVDVMSLFIMTKDDKVHRTHDGYNLIHTITSSRDIPLCSLGKPAKQITRSFHYQLYEQERLMSIQIHCFADNQPTETYEVTAHMDERTDFRYFVDEENPFFQIISYTFRIEKRQISQINTMTRSPQSDKWYMLRWFAGPPKSFYVAQLGEEKSILLNSEHLHYMPIPGVSAIENHLFKRLWPTHHLVIREAQNFYTHFYKPLLNRSHAEIRGKITKQVRKRS